MTWWQVLLLDVLAVYFSIALVAFMVLRALLHQLLGKTGAVLTASAAPQGASSSQSAGTTQQKAVKAA